MAKKVWYSTKKKRGFKRSTAGWKEVSKGDRFFVLIPIGGGKTHIYDSPSDARADGWTY